MSQDSGSEHGSCGEAPWERGIVQVYTGEGKGKTTAALGLALRAVGAGLPVLIVQFCKGRFTSEARALQCFEDLITYRQYGLTSLIVDKPSPEDLRVAQEGWAETVAEVQSGRYAMVVLDEINLAVHFGLVSVGEVLALMATRPPQVELVLTGRRADPRIIEAAELVTEMREIKHPYADGLKARRGIEE